jgi:hypothetical protein
MVEFKIMIKANELRIGNIVEYEFPGYRYPQDAEWGEYTIKHKDIEDCDLIWFRPIPLSEERLIKFGFEKKIDNNFRSGDVFNWQIIVNKKDVDFIMLSSNFTLRLDQLKYFRPIVKMNFVHQLQNLYFALTGEELIYKSDK